MTLVVTHSKVSTVADDPAASATGEVLPSDWNANHTLTGTAAASQLNSNVVQAVVADTNISGSISAQTLTFAWSGTLSAARLNGNVVQAITNDTNITGSISAQTLTLSWSGTLGVARGGTGGGVASGTLLDNITGFASTGFLTRTGAGTYAFQSATNGITNGNLAQAAAYTLKGNATGVLSNVADFTIDSLTLKASPATNDEVMIWDVAGSAMKKATVTSLAGASGVTSIAGNSGAFTLSHGLTNSTNDIQIDVATHRGHLGGLTLSTAGSSSTFSVTAGAAVDSTAADFMKLAAISKTTGAWAVGTGNGALDTGAIANSTWYHVYVIKRTDTGVVDILISLSASSPTMPTSYTLSRRIGSMKTDGSGNWTAFTQRGDYFVWSAPVLDINAAAVATANRTLETLTVPTGVNVEAFGVAAGTSSTGNTYFLFTDPAQADTAAGGTNSVAHFMAQASNFTGVGQFRVMTNTSAQIGLRGSGGSPTASVTTFGWVDRRGRDS